jgi:flagellar basal-body rod protein FlgF
MESPWLIAISRQVTLQREMDAVANNIANVNTPGYKAERMMFSEYLVRPQRNAPLSFVQDRGMMRDLSEGPLTSTGNPLDLALTGDGYFTIDTPDGPRYTRSGRFQLDADRKIVNQLGQPVLSDGGQPITIPIDRNVITIAPDGTVSANTDGPVSPDTAIVGKIGVASFDNGQSMKREANGLYASDSPPTPALQTRVMQGMLEESNVNAIQEMTSMIEINRTYTANQQVLQNEDERMRRAISQIIGAAK